MSAPNRYYFRHIISRYRVLRRYYGWSQAWGFFNDQERADILIGVLFPAGY